MASIPRAILGHIGGGKQGLKVSLPGVNVKTADDNDRDALSFNSEWLEFSIPVYSVNRALFGHQIPHTLGYMPVCDGSVEHDGVNYGQSLLYNMSQASTSASRSNVLVIGSTFVIPTLMNSGDSVGSQAGVPPWRESYGIVVIYRRPID